MVRVIKHTDACFVTPHCREIVKELVVYTDEGVGKCVCVCVYKKTVCRHKPHHTLLMDHK